MADARYEAGELLAVVGAGGVALIDASVSDAVLEAVRDVLVRRGSIGDALQLVTGAYGTTLAAIPPFAVAVTSGREVALAVRGPIEVRVSAEPDVVVTGVGVSTWREQSVADATAVQLVAAAAASGGRVLPLSDGVVAAWRVAVTVDDRLPELAVPDRAASGAGAATPDLVVATPAAPGTAAPSLGAPAGAVPDVAAVDLAAPDPEAPSAATAAEAAAPQVPAAPELPVVPPAATPPQTLPPVAAAVERPDPLDATSAWEGTSRGDTSPPAPAASPSVPAGAGDEDELVDYQYLWERTIVTGVEDAAVRAEADGPPLVTGVPAFAAPPVDEPGDHDGSTVMLSDVRARRAARPTDGPGAPGSAGSAGAGESLRPRVLALRCGAGHDNPPHQATCARCGEPLDGEPVSVARPTLGRLRLPTGDAVALERSVVLGRRPHASRVSGADAPQLVALDGVEVSRNHVEVRIEDWHVLGVDLDSRNGTTLLRAGRPPLRLVAREPVPLRSGDRLDLGEGIVLVLEDLP